MCKEFIEDKVRIIIIVQFCYRYLLEKNHFTFKIYSHSLVKN